MSFKTAGAMIAVMVMLVGTAPTASAHHRTVTVKSGDTLSEIANRIDSPGDWRRLAGRNRLRDPDWITVGQRLTVPHRNRDRDGKLLPRYPNYPAASRSRSAMGGGSRMAGMYNHLDWRALAHCESTNRATAHNPSGAYHGFFQFDLQTWRSVGMSGDPHNYGWDIQLEGAKRLYHQRGRSPWPHCGAKL